MAITRALGGRVHPGTRVDNASESMLSPEHGLGRVRAAVAVRPEPLLPTGLWEPARPGSRPHARLRRTPPRGPSPGGPDSPSPTSRRGTTTRAPRGPGTRYGFNLGIRKPGPWRTRAGTSQRQTGGAGRRGSGDALETSGDLGPLCEPEGRGVGGREVSVLRQTGGACRMRGGSGRGGEERLGPGRRRCGLRRG
jgi:hypothetical protein